MIARVKEGTALPSADGPGRGWLPDGSRMTWLNAPSGRKADRLPVRAAEHNAVFPAGLREEEVSETCTVITTLLDHEEAPADQVREAYLTRWSSCETTFGEDKATITGAGNRTSGPVLRSGRPRLVIQEAWAWLAGTQLTRASAAAALRSEHAAARALRRRDARPVTADEESFTAAWRHAVRSMETSQVTATSSLQAVAAAGDSAARACPAHPQPPRPAAALGTQAESTPEIRAHPRHEDDLHRETRRSQCSRPASTEPPTRPGDRKEAKRPALAGSAACGTARPIRSDTRTSVKPAQQR